MKTPVVLQRFAPRAIDATSTGRTVNVTNATQLQAALDNAQPGDNITLQAGNSFDYGPLQPNQYQFICRNVPGAGDTPGSWISIISSNANLLPPLKRVSPADAPNMAKILSTSRWWYNQLFSLDIYAHHYRFVGLEFTFPPDNSIKNFAVADGYYTGGVWAGIMVGPWNLDQALIDPAMVAHHIVIDRCYFHVTVNQVGRNAIRCEGDYITVENCHIEEFKITGDEAQGIGGQKGNGPYRVVNNYIAAGTENWMHGGGESPGAWFPIIPSDMYFAGNHVIKNWQNWYEQSPDFIALGGANPPKLPVVKNIYEYKYCNRGICEGNIFEYNWPAGQDGDMVLCTVRMGYYPNLWNTGMGNAVGPNGEQWGMVDNIWIRNNIFGHSAKGFSILGTDDVTQMRCHQGVNYVFENNFMYDISADPTFWNGGRTGWTWQNSATRVNFAAGVKVIRNTILDTGSISYLDSMLPVIDIRRPEGSISTGMEFRENIISCPYGAIGADGIGLLNPAGALNLKAPDAKILNNGWITAALTMQDAQGDGTPQATGLLATWVISGSKFAASVAAVGFVSPDPNWTFGDYRSPSDYMLAPSSPFYAASAGGGPIGADIPAILAATYGCYTGDWTGGIRPEPPTLGTATLTSISPSSGLQGQTVRVTLTGTDLAGGEIVPFPGAIAKIVSTSPTSIVADFEIGWRALPFTWPVNVSCNNGPTNPMNFTVVGKPAPIISGISQSSGNTFTENIITVTGQNLQFGNIAPGVGQGSTNMQPIPGVIFSLLEFPHPTDTSFSFRMSITGAASPGPTNFVIENGGGRTTVPFTIVSAPSPNPATLTSVSPQNQLADGNFFTLAFTGQNLADATLAFTPPIPGLWLSGSITNTNTTYSRLANVPVGAAEGVYNATLSTVMGGVSNAIPFTVGPLSGTPPALTDISPASGTAGTSVAVTLTGTDLTGAVLNFSGSGITASDVSATANQITATLIIAAGASIGPLNITVITSGGTSNAISFTVNAAPAPTLSSISPNSGVVGTSVPVTLSGANLTGASINISGSGMTAGSVNATANQITATLVITAGAAAGARSINVTTPSGSSGALNFTVQSTPPPGGGIVLTNIGRIIPT